MFSRLPPVRRAGPLALAVFVLGAGLGGLIIALSHHAAAKRVIVKHIASVAPARTSTVTTTASRAPARPARRRASSHRSAMPAGAEASFATLQTQLAGQVGLAVAPLGASPIQTFGGLQIAHAWSTSKVPVLTTLLLGNEHGGQMLTSEERTDAALALEQSDNAAIEALFADLQRIHGGLVPASAAVQEVLRNAGDDTTTINTAPNDQGFTTYGQTEWSLTGEVQFYRALADGCLLDSQDTAYVLSLMRNVIDSQRWGAGAAGYPSSVPLAFKGGWGPGSGGGYQVRQTAVVGSGDRGYVISMLAVPAGGSFADGTSMLTALASWAREHVALHASTPPARCAASR
jgi:hypothetical protein